MGGAHRATTHLELEDVGFSLSCGKAVCTSMEDFRLESWNIYPTGHQHLPGGDWEKVGPTIIAITLCSWNVLGEYVAKCGSLSYLYCWQQSPPY